METIHGAVIVPVSRDSESRRLMVAGYYEDGRIVDDMRLVRWSRNVMDAHFMSPVLELDTPCIYGGVFMPPYGHFLLETLSRVWALASAALPVVWHTTMPDPCSPHHREIFSLLGVDTSHFIFVRTPTRFRELQVPEAGSQLGLVIHPTQVRALGVFPSALADGTGKVWLSRSALPGRAGRVVGESILEALLTDRGWRVYHPEHHPIREQLEVLASARVIAGFDGSALHSLLLLDAVSSRVIVVRRHPGGLPPNCALVAQAKGFDQEVCRPGMTVVHGRGRTSLTRIAHVAELVDRLEGLSK